MHALIPVKLFEFAKQRLSSLLTPSERAELAAAMLEDMLCVLGQHPQLDGVLIVSGEPATRMLAQRYAVEVLPEGPLGTQKLNGVVRAAVDVLAARGIETVMVLHADLPLITGSEVSALIDAHLQAVGPAFTIAPDRHHDGSNCVLCTPAARFDFRYGRGSFLRHTHQAAARGATISVLDLPGAGFDIDWPQDLEVLLEQPGALRTLTRACLLDAGILERLQMLPSALRTTMAQKRFVEHRDGNPT
jgi:2-phospho-L-lactate guanylyltransferase